MGDASDPYLKIVELSGENASLRREITEAAECGLAVVEEKQQLQQQYSELVDLYESTKNELNCAIEVPIHDFSCSLSITGYQRPFGCKRIGENII